MVRCRSSLLVLSLVLLALPARADEDDSRAISPARWVSAGDDALAKDPGRALGDYEEARKATGKGPAVAGLDGKIETATVAWLRHEAERATELHGLRGLAHLANVTKEAVARKVEAQVTPALDDAARRLSAEVWRDEKARITTSTSAFEGHARGGALLAIFPDAASETRADVQSTRDARASTTLRTMTKLHEESGGHPGARLVRARMVRALGGKADASDEAAAGPGRIAWAINASGCPVFSRVTRNVPRTTGAHPGTLSLDGACDAKDSRSSLQSTRTVEDTEYRQRTVMKNVCHNETVSTTQCKCLQRADINGSGYGTCISYESCSSTKQVCNNEPSTEQYAVQVPRQVQVTHHMRSVNAFLKANGSLEVGGVRQSIPYSDAARFNEDYDAGYGSFSNRDADAMLAGLADALGAQIDREVATARERIAAEHVARSSELADAGQELDAEDAFVAGALASSAPRAVPPGLARKIAELYGVDVADWARFTAAEPAAYRFGFAVDGDVLAQPHADADLLKKEADHAQDVRETRERWTEIETFNGMFLTGQMGLTQTHAANVTGGGPLSHGLSMGFRISGKAGKRVFLMGEAQPAFGYDAGAEKWFLDSSALLGLGVRSSWLGASVYGMVDAVGRASQDHARYVYVPLGGGVGGGLRVEGRVSEGVFVVADGSHTYRISPGADDTTRTLRGVFRYGARLLFRDASDKSEVGFDLGCAFYTNSTSGIFAPSGDARGRSCVLAFGLSP